MEWGFVRATLITAVLGIAGASVARAEDLQVDIDLEVARDLPPEMALQWLQQTPKDFGKWDMSPKWPRACIFSPSGLKAPKWKTDDVPEQSYGDFVTRPVRGSFLTGYPLYQYRLERVNGATCKGYVGLEPRAGRGEYCAAYVSVPSQSYDRDHHQMTGTGAGDSCETLQQEIVKTLTALAAMGVVVEPATTRK